MSVRMISRVWDFSTHKGNDLLMLLAIADFADDDGNAYPAVSTLAAKCRMKPRNANLILAALRASGELEVRQNEGPRGTNRYRVVLPCFPLQVSTGVQKSTGLQKLTRTPVETYPKPLQVSTDEPSVNRQLTVRGKPSAPASPAADLSADVASLESKPASSAVTFKTFLSACKAAGRTPIPEDDAVFEWAEGAGIPGEFLRLAWLEFRSRYGESTKRYKDWRRVFRNAVRDNWFKLWFCNEQGIVCLSNQGRLIQKTHAEVA